MTKIYFMVTLTLSHRTRWVRDRGPEKIEWELERAARAAAQVCTSGPVPSAIAFEIPRGVDGAAAACGFVTPSSQRQ